jgi:hypothetical protein
MVTRHHVSSLAMRIEFPLHFQLYSGSLYYFLRGPMNLTTIETPVAWWKADLESNCGWVFSIDDATRANLTQTIKATYIANKPLFEYTQEDFDLGPAWTTIATTIKEVHHGHGLSLMQNLPHDGLSEPEFKLMNWAIDLHTGVAHPQERVSQYISEVRDVGINYEAPEQKRLLSRLWLALPDPARLPDSWGDFYRSMEPCTVRGGRQDHKHDELCYAFERRQATNTGMSTSPEAGSSQISKVF